MYFKILDDILTKDRCNNYLRYDWMRRRFIKIIIKDSYILNNIQFLYKSA